MPKTELAIIMPAYNEEGSIAQVVNVWTHELQRLNIDFKIHVYNDGSKDRTGQILHDLSDKNNYLVVHDKPNSGHGPTILEGYRDNINAEWIFQIDSDDEIGSENFEKLWEQKSEYDFLIGNRDGRKSPLSRKIVSSISRIVVHVFYGNSIYDVNSPFRLMRSNSLKDVFGELPISTSAPNVIISGIASLRKLRVLEIPVHYKFRTTGEVSIKKIKLLKIAARSFWQTIAFRFK